MFEEPHRRTHAVMTCAFLVFGKVQCTEKQDRAGIMFAKWAPNHDISWQLATGETWVPNW